MSIHLRLLCCFALASMATPALAEWTRSRVPEFGFAADFPAKPEVESSVDNGVKLTGYSAGKDGTLCLVVVGDYGSTVDPEVELPASRDSFAKGVKSEITSQKRILFPRGAKNLQALQFDTASPTYLFRSLIVIEGPQVYQIAGGVPKEGGNKADLDRCIRGFALIVK
jgi:hypothetical protein